MLSPERPGLYALQGTPEQRMHVLTFRVPAEDIGCSPYHAVGIKPLDAISAQRQIRGPRLQRETGPEPVSDLTSFLKGDKGFWIHGRREEGFLMTGQACARPSGRNEHGHCAVGNDNDNEETQSD